MAVADDMQHSVAALHAHVVGVGVAGLRDRRAVQAQQHREGGVGVVEALRGFRGRGPARRHRGPAARPGGPAGGGPTGPGFEAMRPSMWAKR